ncbi:MAG: adenylate/guanylate cyclase domain-containing protein [Chitinophagaceae bacterium]
MRQLAAILFADMTGYTALMQENEDLARVKRRRLKEVLEANIEQHNGKVLQYYGDGSLSIFNSAIDSITCSIKIQRQLQLEPKVELRMGIHTGDIIIEEEAIYGDGVNLASRIESLAVPGGIFISEKVYDEIKNHGDFITREMGYFELKNVKEAVRIFAIANNGIAVPHRDELRGKTKQTKNRLAVLPFVNMSADPENEYFSDGITEELLNALTRVDGLQVTSRTSAFAFKGKNNDIRDIAIQLNVDKILEGSVRKSGNRVRITSQLINAADGYHIWSDTYDRNLTDIFEVQDEISAIITNKLRENLLPAQQEEKLVKAPVKNIEAYTCYLKALHFWNKLTPADGKRCIECCEQAIEMEPGYAQPYSMAAAAYSYLGSSGQMIPDEAFGIVKKYAEKALELDPQLADGHIAKAAYYLLYEWNWSLAFESLQQALKLNPGAIEAYDLLGFYYVVMGQKEKALDMLLQAEQLDPLSPIILQSLGGMYIFNDRFDEAIKQADKLLYMHPRMRASIEMKAWAIGMKGDWAAALPLFEEVHRLTNHPLKGLMGMGYTYAKLGQKDKAMECILKIEKRKEEEPNAIIDADLSAIWFGLGDTDKAFYYLDQCVEKRMGPVSYYLEYPAYRGVKDDPRYGELLKKIGLT